MTFYHFHNGAYTMVARPPSGHCNTSSLLSAHLSSQLLCCTPLPWSIGSVIDRSVHRFIDQLIETVSLSRTRTVPDACDGLATVTRPRPRSVVARSFLALLAIVLVRPR